MREFTLLDHIYAANDRLPARISIPPGDDMAEIELAPGLRLLAAVDQVVAGRHFDDQATPEQIGAKAVARCVSDVAAMAARPVAALAAATLPHDYPQERAARLADALRRAAAALDAPLVGGDVALHADDAGPLVISVTLLATPGPAGSIRRAGARTGDGLWVTGALGGAVASGRHLAPQPRVAAALELAATLGSRLHAMIDLSDGLGRDAGHLAREGGVALRLDAAAIPRAPGATLEAAIGEGEDYELLFAAEGPVPPFLPDGRGGRVAVTRIGEVEAGPPAVLLGAGGDWRSIIDAGWEHA